MRIVQAAAVGLLSCGLLIGPANAQVVRHYDCSKPGNANKSVCKGATPSTSAAPAAPAPAAAAPAKAERHYDCSKAGNANKAACKAVAPAAPAAAPAAPAQAKSSILDRLRSHRPASTPAAPSAPAPQAAAPAAAPSGSYKGKSITTDPAGATGQCKDGTYTHATHHSGACSSHGGVAKWL